MAYEIPVDVDYFDHPKTLKLISILRKPEGDVYPLRLWKWAAKYARSGRLPEDVSAIEDGLKWRGRRGVLHASLVAAGFINGDGVTIHGWQERTGRSIAIYEAKKAKQRERYDVSVGLQRVTKESSDNLPDEGRKSSGILPVSSGRIPPTPDTPEAPDTPDTQDRGERGPIGGPQDPPVSASQGGDAVATALPDAVPTLPPPKAEPDSTGPIQGQEATRRLRQRAKLRKVYSASPKQLDEILTSWEARDGEARVMAALDAGVGQDILVLFDAARKVAPPFRPPKPKPKCGMCDGTGKVADHARSTPTSTVLKPCGSCEGTGKGKA